MSQTLIQEHLITVGECLIFKAKSKIRHEYLEGEVFAMACGKRHHSFVFEQNYKRVEFLKLKLVQARSEDDR